MPHTTAKPFSLAYRPFTLYDTKFFARKNDWEEYGIVFLQNASCNSSIRRIGANEGTVCPVEEVSKLARESKNFREFENSFLVVPPNYLVGHILP